MKLTDLEPRWLSHGGQRVAIMFRCPHLNCPTAPPCADWLTCFFVSIGSLGKVPDDYPVEELRGWRMSHALFYEALKEMGHPDPVEASFHHVVSCNANSAWKRTSDDFATMSITPSLDASQSGNWHGFVTNGEIC